MAQLDPDRRFQIALDKARADWAAADPAPSAALAGCQFSPEGIIVPFFGWTYLVAHPAGAVTPVPATGKPPAVAVHIVLLHYLLTADGAPPADRWLAFRELPDGMFYAQAFAGHAEGEIAHKYGGLGAPRCRNSASAAWPWAASPSLWPMRASASRRCRAWRWRCCCGPAMMSFRARRASVRRACAPLPADRRPGGPRRPARASAHQTGLIRLSKRSCLWHSQLDKSPPTSP